MHGDRGSDARIFIRQRRVRTGRERLIPMRSPMRLNVFALAMMALVFAVLYASTRAGSGAMHATEALVTVLIVASLGGFALSRRQRR